MGFFVFILLSPVLLPLIILAFTVLFNADKWTGEKQEYQDALEEYYDDYSNYEPRAAKGDRDYFTDDPASNYDNYYAQVADDAMMGDRDAIDEMRGEFGDW